MKISLLSFLLLLGCGALLAQENTTDAAITQPIKQFFDGMRQADTSMIRETLFPEASLQTVVQDPQEKVQVRPGDIDRFIKQIGAPHDEVYDEKIWSYEVKADGALAVVWTEYSFFVGERFSHCGVNVFHLIETETGWKIHYIIDTRRKENCRESAED